MSLESKVSSRESGVWSLIVQEGEKFMIKTHGLTHLHLVVKDLKRT